MRGHFAGGPCEGCGFRSECARSHWSCRAFNNYLHGQRWTPAMRGPTVEATKRFVAENAQARREQVAEGRRERRIANQEAERYRERERRRNDPNWPQKNRENGRQVYQRIKADPARYARVLERQRRWCAANRGKVRAQKNASQRRRRAAAAKEGCPPRGDQPPRALTAEAP